MWFQFEFASRGAQVGLGWEEFDMADPIYLNALRAARELWYDEQNLGEMIEDGVQGAQRGDVRSVCAVRVACQWVVRQICVAG